MLKKRIIERYVREIPVLIKAVLCSLVLFLLRILYGMYKAAFLLIYNANGEAENPEKSKHSIKLYCLCGKNS